MTEDSQEMGKQLAALAAHLSARRGELLAEWRRRVDADPQLTAPDALPRGAFNDHIPSLLEVFEKRIRNWPRAEGEAAEEKRMEDSAGHGLQRWQQGYQLREVTREWGHLQMCMARELEGYAAAHEGLSARALSVAWMALAELCSQGVSESTSQYFQLQRAEAEGQVRDMQETLAEAVDLDRRRTELFRQAAHDLRGNVGVVRNVTTGLTSVAVPDATREAFLRLLERSVVSLHTMLDGVLDLARLQAGHELRDVKSFDAAELLQGLVAELQPRAGERSLTLTTEGPRPLLVEGDAVKVRRVAQNLLLNALKYTVEGGVLVTWGDSRDNDSKRWMLTVQDTGPGFHAGPGAPIAQALKDATDEAGLGKAPSPAGDTDLTDAQAGPAPAGSSQDQRPVHQERGEGIGLSIVKRLCELLDATMEMASTPGVGTVFRIVFPRRYMGA